MTTWLLIFLVVTNDSDIFAKMALWEKQQWIPLRKSSMREEEAQASHSYLGTRLAWFCIRWLHKERDSAPLPVIENHLAHSLQVRLTTLRKNRNSLCPCLQGTQPSYALWATETLPFPMFTTGHMLFQPANARGCCTFSSFPVLAASFSRKSSVSVQESILYVFLMYSALALSSTAPIWSWGLLIFSTWTWKSTAEDQKRINPLRPSQWQEKQARTTPFSTMSVSESPDG